MANPESTDEEKAAALEAMNNARTAFAATADPSTPNITYNYDAFPADNNHLPGTLETVTQGGQTWTYKYDGTTFRPLSETSPLGGTAITRTLTRGVDEYGRPGGFTLGTTADADSDHTVDYDYDTAGRLNAVTGAGKAFGYGYAYNQSTATEPRAGHANGSKQDFMPYRTTSPVHAVTRTYEATRDALVSIDNKVATPTISAYVYQVNSLGQRKNLTTSGSAFGGADRGWTWGYDSLGQIETADHTADTSLNRAYSFDDIGNRLTATDGTGVDATTTGYTPNSLNQYEEIDPTPPGGPVTPGYDLDGNLKTDAGINTLGYGLKFGWDAENRLTTVSKTDDTLLATYAYDYLGRRIRRTTTDDAVGGSSDTAYLYDGWNCIAEYQLQDSSFNLHTCYTWGLDLSGSLQGAGGVGGLLCIHRGPGTDGTAAATRTWTSVFYPTYDGNGNVSEYLGWLADADLTTVGNQPGYGSVAHFEYDPFGNLVKETYSTGFNASSFEYKFSTKPLDAETGLYYYGYRYYDPLTGRWPSRDPIGETGGVNLHGFLKNDGIRSQDVLGLLPSSGDPAVGCCGRIIDKWFVDEINELIRGWESYYRHQKEDMGSPDLLGDFLYWIYANTDYKNARVFQFNGENTGCGTNRDVSGNQAAPGLGCGNTVTLCGKCIKTSTLGNIAFGIIGEYSGYLDKASSDVYKKKRALSALKLGPILDPYDQHAYNLGQYISQNYDPYLYPEIVDVSLSDDEWHNGKVVPLRVDSLCSIVNKYSKENGGHAFRLIRPGGESFLDLTSCRKCDKEFDGKKHGGYLKPGIDLKDAFNK